MIKELRLISLQFYLSAHISELSLNVGEYSKVHAVCFYYSLLSLHVVSVILCSLVLISTVREATLSIELEQQNKRIF